MNNQLFYSVSPWDIQLVGTNLIIREAARHILIDFQFEPPNRVTINRGRFLRNGVEVLLSPDRLFVSNKRLLMSGNEYSGLSRILTVGPHADDRRGFLNMPEVARYSGARTESKRWVSEAFPKKAPRQSRRK